MKVLDYDDVSKCPIYEIGAMLARCYMSLSDAWTYANAVERQTKGYDAIKYGGLRRDINAVMELAGQLVQEYKS